jgi:hypothetical protein
LVLYAHEHPPAFGSQHPWHDPFAPQDFFSPRPDQELAIAGSIAPRPESFPFTDDGRRDYYEAVRVAAQQQTMMQHQAMHQMQAARAAQIRDEEAARAAVRTQQAVHLLLMP